MAYHIEGKDIVLNGFEKGISDSVYTGVSDMRNMEIISVPGEAFVTFATAQVVQPPVINAVAFTATASNDTITVSSTTGLYTGAAIVLNTNSAGGITTGTVYYVRNLTATTFTLSLGPATATAINISSDGSGTLSTYQFGGIVAYYPDTTGALAGVNSVFVSDNNGHLWAFFASALSGIPANTLIFMGNIGGIAASGIPGTTGINIWNGYVFLFGLTTSGTDLARVGNLLFSTAATWTYTWQNLDTIPGPVGRIASLVSVEDSNLYWTSSQGLGSLIETPGSSFNPATPATYSLSNGDALFFPNDDRATCIAELGQLLLIGGEKNFIYVWNKIDPGFSDLLNIPDYFTTAIVAASQNAYVFAGVRGRIYITNGSGMDLYKKVPDYVTGFLNPLFDWQDASFGRNQLYFSFYVRDAAGTIQSVDSGLWAIDLDNDALRLLNKTSDAAYAGITSMVTPRPGDNSGSVSAGIIGNNIVIGTNNTGGTVGTLDYSISTPYTNYESFLDTEMIPVGTFLDSFSPSQLEFKLSAPMVSGEGVKISYRTNISEAFVQVGETLTVGALSDVYQANFEKVQWVQFRVSLKSTATTPSYTRLTEMRIRDWPSGVNNKK